MKLIRCEKGHFYDSEEFVTCPHCADVARAGTLENTVGIVNSDSENSSLSGLVKTEAVGDLTATINNTKGQNPVDEQKTIGLSFDKEIGTEPVVGWLVCIKGKHVGEDFKLKSGRNFVGRAKTMDVVLDGDASISREKHAIILYEPRNNIFIAQPGDSKELFYLNEKVVLSSVELHANDVISLGETDLLFIPCCTDKFNWNDVQVEKEREEK